MYDEKSYICNVFFIVLDLRLTILEYSGTPFFMLYAVLLIFMPYFFLFFFPKIIR